MSLASNYFLGAVSFERKPMKRLLLIFALFAFSSASYASNFRCHGYDNGNPIGSYVKVSADSKDEAYSKAMAKFKKIGTYVASVRCEYH